MSEPVPPRVLVITDDVLGTRMAGPAIRAVEIARRLASHQPVTLVSTAGGHLPVEGIDCPHDPDLRALVDRCAVVVLQGAVMMRHPWLHDIEQPIVVDLYDPFHLEALQMAGDDALRAADPLRATDIVESTVRTLSDQIVRGDFFLCATERQRDLWLGHLAAVGRLNHATREGDPDLRRLIDLVPFGIAEEPPAPAGTPLRELVPAIGPDDIVALWAGGIYDWFDPVILIDAVARAGDVPLHLVFLGGRHPNPDVPDMAAVVAARARADELHLNGSRVHFVDEWVEYDERVQLLLDADIGVSTHHRSIETAFSFRTRMLDYLWAGLPVVCTAGDELSDAIAGIGAGRVVAAGDVDSLRDALVELATDTAARGRSGDAARELGARYRWSEVVAPLRRFTLDPEIAPDRLIPVTRAAIDRHRPPPQSGPAHLLHRTRLNLAAGGWRRVADVIRRRRRTPPAPP